MDIDDAKRAMTYVMQKEAVTPPPSVQGERHDMALPNQVAPSRANGQDAFQP